MAILSATSRKTMNLDVLCFGSVVPEVQLLYIYIIFIGCSQLALLAVSWMHNTRHQWSIFYHQLCQPQKLSPQFSSTSSSSKHRAMPLQWNASLFADEMSARQPENHKALEWSSDPKRKKTTVRRCLVWCLWTNKFKKQLVCWSKIPQAHSFLIINNHLSRSQQSLGKIQIREETTCIWISISVYIHMYVYVIMYLIYQYNIYIIIISIFDHICWWNMPNVTSTYI